MEICIKKWHIYILIMVILINVKNRLINVYNYIIIEIINNGIKIIIVYN